MFKFRLFLLTAFVLFSWPSQALNVQSYRPNVNLGGGTQLQTSKTHEARNMSVGYSLNWTRNPLEIGRINDDPRRNGLVNDFVTSNVGIAYRPHQKVMVAIDIPFNFHHNINAVRGIFPQEDDYGPDMGDIRALVNYTIVDPEINEKGWGFAVAPYITLPSGEEHLFFGDDDMTGGLIFVIDKIWDNDNHLYFNAGFRLREKESIANLTIHHEFLVGIGFERPLVRKWRTLFNIELEGSTNFREFFSEEISSPFNLHLNIKKKFLEKNNLQWNIGGTFGATNGYGSPDFRIMTGLVYEFPIRLSTRNKDEIDAKHPKKDKAAKNRESN